jgi:hypothetical protein
MVETKHTAEQCLTALDAMADKSPKMLKVTEWGCMAGDHTGYAFIQGENEEAVRAMLPETLRADAKIVKVSKFTADQIRAFHKK